MAKQTDEIKPMGFEKYMYGELARRFFSSEENPEYGVSALEMLVGKKGLNLGEEQLGFFNGAMEAYRSGEKLALQNSAKDYSNRFHEEKGKCKPIDMVQWYDSILKDIDAATKQKIVGVLGKHDETISKIMEKFVKAGHTAEGIKKGIKYPAEEISETQKTLEKYSGVMLVMQTLDNYKLEDLMPEITNSARKQSLKDLASKL